MADRVLAKVEFSRRAFAAAGGKAIAVQRLECMRGFGSIHPGVFHKWGRRGLRTPAPQCAFSLWHVEMLLGFGWEIVKAGKVVLWSDRGCSSW